MINFKQLAQTRSVRTIGLLLMVFCFLLSGCSDKVNIAQLCDENKTICEEISADNWCKAERIDVVVHSVNVKNNNLDDDKYKLLVAYEGYIKCMSLAAQIQHIKLKEKTTKRKNNLYTAQAKLEQLTTEVAHSKNPHILYYQWSRNSNEEALADFLALEGTKQLESSMGQHHLATYYIKRDTQKTLGLLYRSLELHQPEAELNPEILMSLATILTNKKQYKQAYIWLRAYQLSLGKPDKMIESNLKSYQSVGNLNADFLDDVADSTLDKIQAGKFKSPSY
ncbi:DUF2989 domain-containing protein [Colwellia sp. E2M01]|uniref:DUF2989 domain-containing protein n=1 Tax=Colwellia sp. E2M01 TaxID=2841561 RepID=UPI001C09B131|nr:DUF2989 domain-containing protein [Colwellia sp. E2M01]MBU2871469.1 DUF2989 domain-containing protein [Colwellia sp. E2M01]